MKIVSGTTKPVGASLLAIAVCQATLMSTDPLLSRAGSLPHSSPLLHVLRNGAQGARRLRCHAPSRKR
ncbi:hypothetical protein EAH72_04545 [Pseudomonas caspiana]|uniref:Uncharacterized protein n=1 Tax=Pseudomonas mandelii TaxID=75612 RepID=A0A502IDP5_9PSED|nr:hypothetical protein EAH74_10690 [Pseudomonas mandelii]TPG98207.1 hypothetical protein EAH72_04545 [Pseudomonas caspiana]